MKWVAPIQALIVPKGCSTVARRGCACLRARGPAALHGLDDRLVLPARDPPLLAGRALGLQGAGGAAGRSQ